MNLNYKFVVTDPFGLHARSVTALVNEAKNHDGNIKLRYQRKEANLKSIIGVMALGVPTKAELEIIAEEKDKPEVLDRLKKVIKDWNIAQ